MRIVEEIKKEEAVIATRQRFLTEIAVMQRACTDASIDMAAFVARLRDLGEQLVALQAARREVEETLASGISSLTTVMMS